MSGLTPEQVGAIHVDIAAREYKPPAGGHSLDGATQFLNLPRARVVPEPEPVTWRDLNGRQPEPWEEPLIVAGRERERRAEMALLARTGGD